MVVYCSPCQLNALDVEAKIQRLLHELPLGIRLWRAVSKGEEIKRVDDAATLLLMSKLSAFEEGADVQIRNLTLPPTKVRVRERTTEEIKRVDEFEVKV